MSDRGYGIPELRAQAEEGNAGAQASLGIALLRGDGCPRDYAEALRWLALASERHVPRAMVHLGTLYERGHGVPSDPERARDLYRAGAERGDFLGCIFLARLLASGRCGPPNAAVALHWYREAASHRSRVARCAELDEALAYVEAHGGRAATD